MIRGRDESSDPPAYRGAYRGPYPWAYRGAFHDAPTPRWRNAQVRVGAGWAYRLPDSRRHLMFLHLLVCPPFIPDGFFIGSTTRNRL
jgi:hypothetical protein